MGRIGTKSPYEVAERAIAGMATGCWGGAVARVGAREGVVGSLRRGRWTRGRLLFFVVVARSAWYLRLLALLPSAAAALCLRAVLRSAILPCGVPALSSLRLVYVRATVFCLLTARSMLLLSKRLYSGSYEKRLCFRLAASSRY